MDPKYSERRLLALGAMLTALETDSDDEYAEAYDELIATEREAGEFDGYEPGVCRVCECTDDFPEGLPDELARYRK